MGDGCHPNLRPKCVYSVSNVDDNPITPDKPATDEVRLTQQCIVGILVTGDTVTSVTKDFVWENGLLRSTHEDAIYYRTGSNLGGDETYVYGNDGNCIEQHYVSAYQNIDKYYTYKDGRMTSAIEMNGSSITDRVTITGYTADGHIQALTVEHLKTGTVTDYQLTWENGDMTSYTKHTIQPEEETLVVNIEYDNYPNCRIGMPLAEAVFDPQMIASKASVHNWYILNEEYFYSNGHLVKATHNTAALNTATYYTYSDGTTGTE